MIPLLLSTLRLAAPLSFAAMGGLLCERSGIATICLEGVMLMGGFTAATVTHFTGNPYWGTLAGLIAGALTMSLHAFLSITARADRIISAVAVNVIAAGLTPFLTKVLFGSPTNTASLPIEQRLSPLLLVGVALALPLALHYVLYYTKWGLRIIAAGDGPEALKTAGVSPGTTRYLALFAGGAVASLGGTFMAICHSSQFTRDMTAGRGYIALTALIFGKWKPLPALGACLFFGFADALQIQLQSTTIAGHSVPVQFVQMFPYLVTLFVLIGFIGKARAPLAIGER